MEIWKKKKKPIKISFQHFIYILDLFYLFSITFSW